MQKNAGAKKAGYLFSKEKKAKKKRERNSRKIAGECSGENKSRKRIGDQSGSVHCCPTWSPPTADDHHDDDEDDDDDVDDEQVMVLLLTMKVAMEFCFRRESQDDGILIAMNRSETSCQNSFDDKNICLEGMFPFEDFMNLGAKST